MLKEKSLFTYFLEAFTKNYANFKGRSRRREYWGFALWYCVIFLVSIVLAILTGIGTLLLGAFIIITIVPSIALTVRRLHDISLSGWFALFLLVSLIPGIGEIIALVISVVIGVIQGNNGANKFGEDPLIDNQAITDKTNS